MTKLVTYNAPPIMGKFINSNAFGRLVAGPVGSGKTHGTIIELLRRASQQEKAPDGYRYTRWAIIRQTLQQLKSTVVKDMRELLEGIEEYRVSDSTIKIFWGDLRCEILLIPMEDPKDQKRLLSAQLTGAWISECIEVSVDLLGPIMGRLGRFPNKSTGTPTWKGLICDTNFPLEGSDWHAFMENPPANWDVFKQPGGLEPGAENLQWLNQNAESLKLPEDDPIRLDLGREYYRRLAMASSQEYITRYIDAKYGTDPSGMAVFKSSFKRSFHVVDELEPVHNRMLVVGQDFGRNPWSIICQMDHRGRLLVLEEVSGVDVGLSQHIKENLRPALMQLRYMGRPVVIIGDPAGRAKSSLYEVNEFDVLRDAGFSAYPAPTNDLEPRLRAVERFLLGQRDGGPEMVIDGSRCPVLVQALNGGYRFTKNSHGVGRPTPDKNKFSHVTDATQYACLVCGEPNAYARAYGQIMNTGVFRQSRPAPPVRAWT